MERFSWHRWVRSLSTRNARTVRKTRPLAVESLEARETPATFTWDGGSSLNANWSDPANWAAQPDGVERAPTGVKGADEQLVFPSGNVNGRLNTNNNIVTTGQPAPVFGSILIGG